MQFQKKEKRQTTVRFDSHHVRLRTGEVQRKTGSYMYRWTDKLGKRNTIYAATLEDLREQEEQILVDQHDGIKANIKNVTVNDVYELWCQLKRGIKDSTMKNYIYMYELFVKPTFGKKKLVQVKKSDVRRFYNQLIDDKVLKPSTVDVIHNIVHQVFQIAVDDDMMRASRYKFGSVPDVYVIDSGALKGFVSISPTWSGIDNRAFQDISRQVYNEDEFCELQRRANIMNGRTHSNVVSMTLNDYRVAPGVMFMTRSDPQLTFSQRSMKLNAVCWEKLGQQKYVEFLYHPVLEVIAVRSCNATNPNAVLWDETKKSGLQLCTSAFSNAVYDKLDWMRKYKFRFRGVTRVRGGERIIFFFLDEPQILVGKDKKNLDAMGTSDSSVKYIPYKESECGEAAGLTAGIAYPENWQEQVGVSYEIKQQRGRVLDAVSSADIRNHGTKVVNPFIGVIPTHGELEDELEQIYEAM